MDAWDRLEDWLDRETGLRLIAPFYKTVLLVRCGAQNDSWVASAAQRVEFVARHLEPLAGAGRLPELSGLCDKVARLDDVFAFAELFHLTAPEDGNDPPWSDWAKHLAHRENWAAALYCRANDQAGKGAGEAEPARELPDYTALSLSILGLAGMRIASEWLAGVFDIDLTLVSDKDAVGRAIDTTLAHTGDDWGAVRLLVECLCAPSGVPDAERAGWVLAGWLDACECRGLDAVTSADGTWWPGLLARAASGRTAEAGAHLIERWLALSRDMFKDNPFDIPERIWRVLSESRLGRIANRETQFVVVKAYADCVRRIELCGPRAAFEVLLGWLGVRDRTEGHDPTWDREVAGQVEALDNPDLEFDVLKALGELLSTHPAPPCTSGALWAHWLGTEASKLNNPTAWGAIWASENGRRVPAEQQLWLLCLIADLWLRANNRHMATLVLPLLSHALQCGNPEEAVSRARACAGDPGREAEQEALFVLASAWNLLGDEGNAQAVKLASGLLDLPDLTAPLVYDHLQDAVRGSKVLQGRPQAGHVVRLIRLAEWLTETGETGAAKGLFLMEWWFGLPTDVFGRPDARDAVRGALCRSPLGKALDPAVWRPLLHTWAAAYAATGRRDRARLVFDAWLGAAPHQFASAPCLAAGTVSSRLEFARDWLQFAEATFEEVVAVCEAVIDLVETVGDQLSRAPDQRRDFYAGLKDTQECLTTALTRRIGAQEDSGTARALAGRILTLLEPVTARLLWERLANVTEEAAPDPESLPAPAKSTDPPLQHVEWPSGENYAGAYLPPSYPGHENTGKLDVRPAEAPQDGRGRRGRARPALARPVSRRLGFVLPPNTLWVRTVLDPADGRLVWFLSVPGGHEPVVIASGSSGPGARERLQAAVARFEFTVDRIWLAFATPSPSPLLSLEDYLICEEYRDLIRTPRAIGARFGTSSAEAMAQDESEFLARFNAIRGRFPSLPKWFGPALAYAAARMALQVGNQKIQAMFDCWLNGWWDDVEYLYTKTPWQPRTSGSDGPPPHWREDERRRQLDAATDRLMDDVRADFDLGRALGRVSGLPDLGRIDVVFEVDGPLLNVPLAFLPYGDRPLFEVVASTSVSPTAPAQPVAADGAPKGLGRIISAQWLPRDEWRRMTGLAHAAAGLDRVARRHGWEIMHLADRPQARRAAVDACVNASEQAVLVTGGHGCTTPQGVHLADGVWRGAGSNLANVVMLVLVACSAGRRTDDELRDVDNSVCTWFARGARHVIAPRWPIADREAATLAVELVNRYLLERRSGSPAWVSAARALNAARRDLLNNPPRPDCRISRHLAAAFDSYTYFA